MVKISMNLDNFDFSRLFFKQLKNGRFLKIYVVKMKKNANNNNSANLSENEGHKSTYQAILQHIH